MLACLSDSFLYYLGNTKDVLIICFSAFQGPRQPTFDFYKSISARKDTDCIFVRDTEDLWYQAGTADAIGDPGEIIKYLRGYMRDYKRVVLLGGSMGGYMALTVMPTLRKADLCVTFGPQTFIDTVNRKKHHDDRWDDRMQIINKAMKSRKWHDLQPYYREVWDGSRPIYIIYGEETELDVVHAKHMTEFQNIKVLELKGVGHKAALYLRDTGILQSIISQAIAGNTIELPSISTLSS